MTALIFSLLILFLPTQLGKHFWPFFAFVSGQRIDYLSPTVYLSDILIILFVANYFLPLIFSLKRIMIHDSRFLIIPKVKLSKAWIFFLVFLVIVAIGVYNSLNPLAGWYGFLKMLELVAFSFAIRKFLAKKERFALLHVLFSVAILFESFLTFIQFFHHGSIGGIFYFFGERSYSGITPGIANVSVNGQLLLRPYATFSHPNVLAGFLLISMTILTATFPYLKRNWQRIFTICALCVGSVALLTTFSRVAIVLWLISLVCLGIFFLSQKEFHKEIPTILLIFSLLAIFSFIGISFPLLLHHLLTSSYAEQSLQDRLFYIHVSLQMLKQNPLFGVGLYNFLDNLPRFITGSSVNMLQPVHNIFLLLLSQLGIIGVTFIMWFLLKTIAYSLRQFKRLKAHARIIPFASLLCFGLVLVSGMFDHYFLTLQQGQLLLALVLGMCWAKFDTITV